MLVVRSFVMLLLVILMLPAALAEAVPTPAQVVSNASYGEMNITVPSESAGPLFDGEIMKADIATNFTTLRWAGVVGNASGTINLGDGGGNAVFSWDNADGNMIYATEGVPNWASLQDATSPAVTSAYPHLADPEYQDSYDRTFRGSPEDIGSDLFSITSDYAPSKSAGTTVWKTYSLTDTSNIIFAAKVNRSASRVDYRGGVSDFQVIVPEDGSDGSGSPTTYNLYVELI